MSLVKRLLVTSFFMEELDIQVQLLRDEFGLSSNFRPELCIKFESKARVMGGVNVWGEPEIDLPIKKYMKTVGKDVLVLHEEYPFIEKRKDIGNCWGTWDAVFAVVLAHELAHCVTLHKQSLKRVSAFYPKKYVDDRRGHGLLWQAVYKFLRNDVKRRFSEKLDPK